MEIDENLKVRIYLLLLRSLLPQGSNADLPQLCAGFAAQGLLPGQIPAGHRMVSDRRADGATEPPSCADEGRRTTRM